MVLGTRTQTSIKLIWEVKKKKKKTGNRNGNPDSSRTEGSEHLAPALGWDGNPGEAGLSWRAPRERAPLAGPPPPRGTPGTRAARRDPGSHAAPRPTPRDSPQRAAAPPRAVRRPSAAPPGPPRPTPGDSLWEPSSTRSNSQSGDRVSTAIAAAAPPTDRAPSCRGRDAGLTPAAVTARDFRDPAPPPRATASGRSALWTAGASGKASPSACARRGRHSDDGFCILHPSPVLAAVCVCSLAAFSFSYAASRLFKHLRELLYQSNGERAEITGWGPTQRQGPFPGHFPGPRTKMLASPALFWLYPRSSHPVHVLPHLFLFVLFFDKRPLCIEE